MTAYPAWTPAPRPGIVPLHPYGFGTTLGRSFTALRQNPAVLLGFALCVQALAYLVLILAVGGVAFASFLRLESLTPGSEDFEAVMAGSIALTAITGVVLTIAVGALGVIVQGIVVAEVSAAVVAEKLSLGALWRRVRPAAWRLIGWSFLLTLVLLVAIAVVAGVIIGLGFLALPLAIVLGILAVVGAVPLSLWLSTKLLLVPAAILLEGASIAGAIRRSWQLTRGRFWPTLGVIVLVQLTFSVLAQLVGIPLQFVAMGLGTVITPTGEPEVGAIIAILVTAIATQIVTILIQCVALIVQSTATTLIYVDCRMRAEGLDLDLLSYVENRDAGATDPPDPYRLHIGRAVAPRPAYAPAGYPQGGYAVAGLPGPGYPVPGSAPGYVGAPPRGHAPAGYPPPYAGNGLPAPASPGWGPAPGAPVPGPGATAPQTGTPAEPAPPVPPAPSASPSATEWAAPGSSPERS